MLPILYFDKTIVMMDCYIMQKASSVYEAD